jgi:N-dimethylarginine dimethylaminohydrolase
VNQRAGLADDHALMPRHQPVAVACRRAARFAGSQVISDPYRYVVSPASYLDPHYLLNPWMAWHEALDRRLALRQWEELCLAVEDRGAGIEVLPPRPEATAMTYMRDASVVLPNGEVLILLNDGPRSTSEPQIVARWLAEKGVGAVFLPQPHRLDGGNILRCSDGRWLVGLKPGGDRGGAHYFGGLVRRHGAECVGIPLADPAFVHLDLVMADLAGRGWLVYRSGLAEPDLAHPRWRAVLGDRPVIEVERDEAYRLACNVLVIGDAVLGCGLTPRLCRAIEGLGLEPVEVDLSEFRKGGGGVHCLTQELSYKEAA